MVNQSFAARRLARFRPFWPILLLAAAPTSAGDTPRYEAAPDWANRAQSLPTVADEQGIVLFDRAYRIENGELWSYTDLALKITSPEMLSQGGTVSIQWQPDDGDAIVHRLEIVRDGQVIDALGDQRFEILRREQGLERLSLDGQLTATHQVQGLRVGDTLRFSSSTIERDPVLDGHVQLIGPLIAKPANLGGGAVRVSWPADQRVTWKLAGVAGSPQPVRDGRFLTLTVDQPVAKLPEAPDALPMRLRPVALFEATTFRDWGEVSALGARLFAPTGLIADGSDLARRTDAIAAASDDPATRAAGALRLVQDDVRYLFNGLSGGNYRPQTPAETWERRYGDCKAKTLLLLAMLDRMGIEGEAVLVNSALADAVANRVPSFAAFDHVLVRAQVGGRTAWLDGTRLGTRLPDLFDAPPFRIGLPLRAAGTELLSIPMVPLARPLQDMALDYDVSAGLAFPALFTVRMTLREDEALQMRSALSAVTAEQAHELLDARVLQTVPDGAVTERAWHYDEAAGALVIEAKGLKTMSWTGEGGERAYDLTSVTDWLTLDQKRFGQWADAPVSTGTPSFYREAQAIRLPASGQGFTVEGQAAIEATLGGYATTRTLRRDGDRVEFVESQRTAAWEVPAAELPAEREQLARATSEPLQLVAPVDYPSGWQEIRRARETGALKPLIAAYDQLVADDPKEAEWYVNRARFYEGVLDRPRAIADLTKAIEFRPDADTYNWRGWLRHDSDPAKAATDYEAALALDPSHGNALWNLFDLALVRRDYAGAQAVVDRARRSGLEAAGVTRMRAELAAEQGRAEEGLAQLSELYARKPATPDGLNDLCWFKARYRVELPSALKDCTRAIELGSQPAQYLDSRALVYLQMDRPREALADLDAVLAIAPDQAASTLLRGIARKRLGSAGADDDLAMAAEVSPVLTKRYVRYGMKP